MTACVVCGRACTPMADYEQTVCFRCDDVVEEMLVRARATVAAPRPPALRPHGTHAAFNRHRKAGTAPCAACVTAERAYNTARKRVVRSRARLLAVAS